MRRATPYSACKCGITSRSKSACTVRCLNNIFYAYNRPPGRPIPTLRQGRGAIDAHKVTFGRCRAAGALDVVGIGHIDAVRAYPRRKRTRLAVVAAQRQRRTAGRSVVPEANDLRSAVSLQSDGDVTAGRADPRRDGFVEWPAESGVCHERINNADRA